MTKRFQIIYLGNAYDFVVKDHKTNRTYGTFQGDKNSMLEMLDNLNDEIKELQVQLNFIRDQSNSFKRKVIEKNNSIGILKKQLESEHQMLDNAILLERTRMGQSALKQYKEAIQ
jgi:predicted  nucleic acid-binding Zn-ribbon protein